MNRNDCKIRSTGKSWGILTCLKGETLQGETQTILLFLNHHFSFLMHTMLFKKSLQHHGWTVTTVLSPQFLVFSLRHGSTFRFPVWGTTGSLEPAVDHGVLSFMVTLACIKPRLIIELCYCRNGTSFTLITLKVKDWVVQSPGSSTLVWWNSLECKC